MEIIKIRVLKRLKLIAESTTGNQGAGNDDITTF
jgi:hypothetical protein